MGAPGPSLAPPPVQPVVAAPATARLNLFQRTLLRWRELRPYNAVHALRVAGPLEPARLQTLIGRRLDEMNLTRLFLDPEQGALHRLAGAADDIELRVLARREDPLAVLWEELETQLNTPFPRAGPLSGFRFFAVPADGGFYLALVYDHFIAAGDAIAWLLRSVVADYSAGGAPVPPPTPPPRLGAPAYRSLLLRHPFRVLWAMLRLPRLVARARRAARPPGAPGSPATALAYLALGRDEVEALRAAASAWDATLNDLLLAGLLHALAPLAPERGRARRRRELAVASIVSIRHELPVGSAVAGPFLASFHVSHPVPPGIGLRELVQAVHGESARIRREGLYLQTLASLGVSALMWPFLSPGQRERFFSKYHPVWGGVSLLNINALWTQTPGGPPVPAEYFRTVSTGPACPLVLTVTAARDTLHVVVSFRGDVFARPTVEALIERLRQAVAGLRDGIQK